MREYRRTDHRRVSRVDKRLPAHNDEDTGRLWVTGRSAYGIAGTREKSDWVTRHARLSACINHAGENVSARLRQLAPRGVDVYFDNTGGELLESIVAGRHLAPGGRIVQNSVKPVDPEAILARGGYQSGKDGVQVLRAEDQDAVQKLAAQGADQAFADRVAPHRQLHPVRMIGTAASG